MRKRTKIIATISDQNCSPELISEMFNNGMNAVRLNTAHQNFEGSKKVIENVRKVSDKIAIIIDTKGPEIRTVALNKSLELKTGDKIKIKGWSGESESKEYLFVTYPYFVDEMEVGKSLLIDDGEVELKIIEKKHDYLICEAKNDGIIQDHKSVNVPGSTIDLPTLTPKDIDYINFAIENNVDFIAHSFVRKKEDVIAVKSLIESRESKIKVIAKIENQEGVNNIDEILEYAYGIMVARGDLALEIPAEKIPGVQKMIINKCIRARKPVIVATQMLHSMIVHPRPTRAEISDVANAVYDGADTLMLSGETAYGKYPLEALKMMTSIAKEVEANTDTFKDIPPLTLNTKEGAVLTKFIVEATEQLPIKAIVADTTSGRTIRGISAYRGKVTIYAQVYDKSAMRHLTLSYGVYVDYMKPQKNSHDFLKQALKNLIKKQVFSKDNTIGVIAGDFGRGKGASYIKIAKVEDLMNSFKDE